MDVETQHRVIKEHKAGERKAHRGEAVTAKNRAELKALMDQCPSNSQQWDMLNMQMRAIESNFNLVKVFQCRDGSKRREVQNLLDQLNQWLDTHPGGQSIPAGEVRGKGASKAKGRKRGRPRSAKNPPKKSRGKGDSVDWVPAPKKKKAKL